MKVAIYAQVSTKDKGKTYRTSFSSFANTALGRTGNVEGVPQNNDVHDQPQRTELVLLSFPVPLSKLSSLTVEDGTGQLVPVFASI